jgi:hypothetical protein
MEDGFQGNFNRLPFLVLELHPDNGVEFFNRYLIQFWKDQVKGLRLSRSRPYEKIDNRFVEKNNFSCCELMSAMGVWIRLLKPVCFTICMSNTGCIITSFSWMRLKHKSNLPGQLRSKRIYDRAQPPFDRLCAQGVLSAEKQHQLQALREATNPYQLRLSIEKLITQLFQLPGDKEGVTKDVYQTLGLWHAKQLSKAEQTAEQIS